MYGEKGETERPQTVGVGQHPLQGPGELHLSPGSEPLKIESQWSKSIPPSSVKRGNGFIWARYKCISCNIGHEVSPRIGENCKTNCRSKNLGFDTISFECWTRGFNVRYHCMPGLEHLTLLVLAQGFCAVERHLHSLELPPTAMIGAR